MTNAKMTGVCSLLKKSITAFGLVLCLYLGKAQEHYWSQQYGGQATLTGGTAVVGLNDHSCIYYNPGAMAFADTARITASTFAVGFEHLSLKNGAGDGLRLKSTRANLLPQLLAATVNIPKVPRLRLVFGLLTRTRTNIRLTQENDIFYDAIPGATGDEHFKALAEYTYSSVEQWSGISLSYQIGNNWAIGVSSFGSFLNLDTRVIQNAQVEAMSNGVPYIATVNEYRSVVINQVTQIFKIGAAARFKKVQLGIAFTPPGIKLWGEGKLSKSFEAYHLNQFAVDTNVPAQRHSSFLISDLQRGIKSRYLIPLSASVGVKVLFKRFNLSLSAEYFMGYRNRIILSGEDRSTYRPAGIYGGDTVPDYMTLATKARAVFNVGIGAEILASKNISILCGLRTDFSNRTDYLPNNAAIGVPSAKTPHWNYYYLSAGFTYRRAMHNLTIGADYGLGLDGKQTQMFSLTEPTQDHYLHGELKNNMQVSAHKFSLLISYIYFFKGKERKRGFGTFIDEMGRKKQK